MLPGTGFPISGDSLRNWLRTAGQSLFSAFETGADALNWIRENGGSIRTQDFYDIRRQVLDISKHEEQLSAYDGDSLIPAAWHDDTHGLNLNSAFLYRVRVDGTDPNTGDQVTKYFAISSNTQLTPNQVTDALGDMLVGEEDFYEVIAEDMTVTAALSVPGVFNR